MSEDKENILFDSVRDRLRYYKKHPTKALVLPALCVGYAALLGALYLNVYMYHIRHNKPKG